MAKSLSDEDVLRVTFSKYDWEAWADGNWWEAERGKDFDVEPESFAAAIYGAARTRGCKATVRTAKDKVYFRFLK